MPRRRRFDDAGSDDPENEARRGEREWPFPAEALRIGHQAIAVGIREIGPDALEIDDASIGKAGDSSSETIATQFDGYAS